MKKFNLSIVINDDLANRLDLMTASLKEIDLFTTKFSDSNKIKSYFHEPISAYLIKNYSKSGALVITYQDEDSNYIRRIRVLYQDEAIKTNVNRMPSRIKNALNKHDDVRTTLTTIKRFTPYIFGSYFEKGLIYKNEQLIGLNKEKDTKINKMFTNDIIYNNLNNTLNNNPDIGYFKVRLIDSYLHKIGIETIDEKKTSINIVPNNVEKTENSKLKKNNQYSDKSVKFKEVGPYYQEDDGQLNLFDNEVNRPRVKMKDYLIDDYGALKR